MTEDPRSAEPQPSFGTASANSRVGLEPWLIFLLACPVDRASVRAEGSELVCDSCGRHYSVYDRIPVMIAAELVREHKF